MTNDPTPAPAPTPWDVPLFTLAPGAQGAPPAPYADPRTMTANLFDIDTEGE